jgi:hypothetical protein
MFVREVNCRGGTAKVSEKARRYDLKIGPAKVSGYPPPAEGKWESSSRLEKFFLYILPMGVVSAVATVSGLFCYKNKHHQQHQRLNV